MPTLKIINEIIDNPPNKIRRYDVRMMAESIVALNHQFHQHRAGAFITCDEKCFCWQAEQWLNNMNMEEEDAQPEEH